MKTSIRISIVAVAGTVALGTFGFAAAANADTPPLKREDSSSAVLQDVDLDDLDDGPDPRSGQQDDPTNNTRNTAPTNNTKNTAPTKNTIKTVNTAPTRNTAPTKNTAPTGPTSGTS